MTTLNKFNNSNNNYWIINFWTLNYKHQKIKYSLICNKHKIISSLSNSYSTHNKYNRLIWISIIYNNKITNSIDIYGNYKTNYINKHHHRLILKTINKTLRSINSELLNYRDKDSHSIPKCKHSKTHSPILNHKISNNWTHQE